jgi:diguanylate cyclase (GGDEF)-like protein
MPIPAELAAAVPIAVGSTANDAERELSSVLSEFASTMLTDFPIQGILEHLVQRIVDVLPISGAGVTLISSASAPRYVAASDASALHFEELQTELNEGPCLAAFHSGEAVIVPDLLGERRFNLFAPRAMKIGLSAVFAFPLRQSFKRLGALDLYRNTPGTLSTTEFTSAQTLADVTAAYLVNAQARSDLQDSSDRSHERSVHDALTGLPNRILLRERIEHAIVRSGRSKKLVALLFIDLDHFKDVNDAHGHQTGDELLIALVARLSGVLRPADTLARLSGDEFVILCEELDAPSQVEIVASRVVEALARPFSLTHTTVEVSASVGLAFAGQANHDPDQLLHAADLAMYQVKHEGGDSYQIIDLRVQNLVDQDLGLRSALSKAVEREELHVEYQPIVRTSDGRIHGVEALLRWDHPIRGPISPSTMIPLAEQSGLIVELGRWMIERACIDRKRWSRPDDEEPFMMNVNVSAQQLMAPDFVAMVTAILAECETEPEVLTLEITEGALVGDTKRALIVLTELKRLGLQLALDDFGTGYSSLSYLKRFPVDIVKIDQTFITDVARDRSSYAIVSKTIELAHLLDLTVVCEGVEIDEQVAVLSALDSEFCQGFYFARPMVPELLDTLVREPTPITDRRSIRCL